MKSLVPAAALAAAAVALAAGAPDGRAGPREVSAGPREVSPGPRRFIALPPAPRQCPEIMRDVELVLRPVTGGISLEFTSQRPRQVAALRDQLRDAALVVETYSKLPERGLLLQPADSRIPPLEISVNDVGAGALVVIRAQRARDLPELLDLARAFELLWSRSDCNERVARGLRALPSLRA